MGRGQAVEDWVLPLAVLKSGETARVLSIECGYLHSKRLSDLGFTNGAELTMLRTGCPCIVRLDGRCVGLGRLHQSCIRVRTTRAASHSDDRVRAGAA